MRLPWNWKRRHGQ